MISDPENPTLLAKEYATISAEYEKVKNEATIMLLGDGLDPELMNKVTILKDKLEHFNNLFYNNPHIIVPQSDFSHH